MHGYRVGSQTLLASSTDQIEPFCSLASLHGSCPWGNPHSASSYIMAYTFYVERVKTSRHQGITNFLDRSRIPDELSLCASDSLCF